MRLALCLVSGLTLLAQTQQIVKSEAVTNGTIRQPLGVYAKVDIEDAIAGYPGSATPTPVQLHTYLQALFATLLSNPAISGLTVGERWDNIELTAATDPSGFNWSYLDDAFAAATTANKGVQLIITPGFDSPQWLLSKIPSCDPLFNKGTANANCGSVTFTGFPEQQRADGKVLPLPWNTVYQQAWAAFLAQLNTRYGANPVFNAIAVAGPMGASTEIILPTSANDTATQPSGLDVDSTWAALIAHSFPANASYLNTDQVFIDAWKQAIDTYEQIFSGVTLFISPDAGGDLPNFSATATPHSDNTLFASDCSSSIQGKKKDQMSCEAKTEILSYFLKASGSNGKSTQVGGMTASSPSSTGDIGIAGVKVLTGLSPAPSPAFLGGAEFDHPVSDANLQLEGCPNYPAACPGLTPEAGAYYALTVFFSGTPAAAFYGGAVGTAPMSYLEVSYSDLQYASATPCPAAPTAPIGNMSLQDLLNRASHDLLGMAGQMTLLPALTCAGGAAPSPLTISTTAALPAGSAGVAYAQTLAATGGTSPYSWTVSSGALPPGLTLSTSGQISGTPTSPVTSTFTVQVTDANGSTATQAFTIVVAPPSSTLLLSPDGTTVYDSVHSISWLVDFDLPASNQFGLPVCNGVIDTKTCVNTSGSMTYQAAAAWVKAMNAANYLGQSSWQIPTSPSGDMTCSFTGGASNAFGWGCSASAFGGLYNALGLSAPNTAVPVSNIKAGPFNNFQPDLYWSQTTLAQPQDQVGCCGTFSFNSGWQGSNITSNFLFLLPMIQGKIAAAPAGGSGTGLQVNPGGQTVYDPIANVTWLADANLAASNTFGLPACKAPGKPALCVSQNGAMNFDSASQFVTNMNAAAYLGQSNWQIPMVDPTCASSYVCSVTNSPFQSLFYFQLGLTPGTPVVTAPTISVGPFTGIRPYLYWTCEGDTIQSPCQTAGPAPGFEWSFWFVNGFQGTDVLAHDMYVTAYFTGTPGWVTGPVISTSAQLPSGTVGVPYSQTLAASGGAAPYTWSLSAGALPAGLALTPDGTISGTPTAAGSSSFTVQVMDSNSASATLAMTLAIQAPPTSLPVTNGVYLGVWANPSSAPNQEAAIEILEGPPPKGIGRTFNFHLVYLQWGAIAAQLNSSGVFQPNAALSGDISHGRVPVISWNCDAGVANFNHLIAGGDTGEDAIITASAQALKQYPGPVMLRWFWEFNLLANNQVCRGDTGGKPTQQVYNDFIGAWQHIWTLFQQAGATNVVFLWNPGSYTEGGNNDPHGFYPGNGYVDWIGIDTYQRQPTDTFDSNFGQFYNDFSISQYAGKPLMVGENGAQNYSTNNTELQAPYLQGLFASVQSGKYPLLKAYDYFDAPGNPPGSWVLDDNNSKGNGGLAELAILGGSAGFAPAPGSPSSTPLSISTGAQLPSGTVGVPYSQTLAAAGGAAPYTWTVTAGTLPAGLALTGDGTISGTPTVAGSSSFTVQVTDSNSASTTLTMTLVVQAPALAPLTYYVSPSGNDTWSGTISAANSAGTDGPFATFDHARMVVQSLDRTAFSQISVQFRGGTYYLPATEQFTAADSGTPTTPIVYQNYAGETPVFSGGIPIQNWTNAGGNKWMATLPASTQYFENLFYNGVRRLRPRLGGGSLGTYYRIASTVYLPGAAPPAAAPDTNCSVYIAGSGWECFDRFQYAAADPISATWKNLVPAKGNQCSQKAGNQAIAGDIEVLVFEQFSTSKLRISCIDTANQIVYLTGSTPISQSNSTEVGFITGNRYLVDNVQDELTQPGQWFLDHSTTPWTLTYLANPGENPNTDSVIVPQLPQVLVASGLQYVTFQGLTFEHDNYTIPAAGHKSSELEADISAAVSFQNSQYITFDSGTVTQISGTGLEFISCLSVGSPDYCVSNNKNAITANNTIQNSAFYDIGVLGIRIGDPFIMADSDANVPFSMTVQNNVVEGYGRTIPAAFGIGQGHGHDNLYTHNEVYDGYHCAISISLQAGNTTKPNGVGNANNTISFNHVYNLLQGILNDGGSIRIEAGNEVFTSPGNKILNNKIHDVTDASIMDPNGYGGHGIYMDNQTGLVDVENNLVYRVSASAIYTPHGPAAPDEANTIKNNILAFAQLSMVNDSGPYQYFVPTVADQSFVVSNNLFYFDRSTNSMPPFRTQGGCVYAAGFPFAEFQSFSSNLYWRTDGGFAMDPKAFHVQPSAGPGPNAPCSDDKTTWTFYTFSEWQQQVGEDAHSVVQNPGFKNPGYPADDYSLPNGSPGVGFVVFDPTQAGRSNPVLMPPVVAATFPTKLYDPAKDY